MSEKYNAYVFNTIKVDRFGEKVSDDIVQFPWGRVRWALDNMHTPNVKDKDERYTAWVRVHTKSPEKLVNGAWEWCAVTKEDQQMYRELDGWSEWISYDNLSALAQIIGVIDDGN
jgi:hypothetical protein